MKNLFLILATFGGFIISCLHSQPESNQLLDKNPTQLIAINLLDTLVGTSDKDSLRILVETDSLKNIFIKLLDKRGFLFGAAGTSFSSLLCEDGCIKRLNLQSSSSNYQLVLFTYDLGSTFGRQALFVIWKDDDWNIVKSNFSRPFLEDRNGDGIFEIIEYYQSSNPDGDVYYFENGNFLGK